MKGIFWNCRGAGKKGMSTCLTDMINANELDFIGLQETMKETYKPSFFRKIDPNQKFHWEWAPSRGKSGGILCGLSKDNFDILMTKHGKYVLQLDLFDKNKSCSWVLIIVYGVAHDEQKPEFIVELSAMCHNTSKPYLVGGILTSSVIVGRRIKKHLCPTSQMCLILPFTYLG